MPLLRTLALLSALVAGPAALRAAPVLRVTAIPDVNKDTLREDQDRLASWLGKKLGVVVEFQPVENYAAAVTALVNSQADLGWLGGVTAVQAMRLSGGSVRPIVTREADRHFKSLVIVRTDLQAHALKDLVGKSFAFGSKSSTSGHVMPRYFLEQQGIIPEKAFSHVAYTGDHTKTVLDVASGAVDAGAVNYLTFERMIADKKVDPTKVTVLWTTPEFVDYAWCARSDVDARFGSGTLARITDAFVALDRSRPEDQPILAVQQADRYVKAQVEWWDGIGA
ncbi:MAG TPA: putative selenate ABC transporter substrate-binding protein, partial [Vicinamibacteria bacterium]|nr:putative selenate ABC transporter substrate-binding protein [Vicinamibacteria bacterium]